MVGLLAGQGVPTAVDAGNDGAEAAPTPSVSSPDEAGALNLEWRHRTMDMVRGIYADCAEAKELENTEA